ncbi:hypothetical protein P7K49_014592 [Saguinus oedipus]|uniref:Uncharacterized protein n=1 Tax=Saguinus oedipus TaxID=9490 RepID=A0ABQ9V6T7_SAGOE|nr:hypothetical protein P7K49_014592 [Saguinus oedipus]
MVGNAGLSRKPWVGPESHGCRNRPCGCSQEPSRGKTGRSDGSVEGSHRLFCGARLPHLPEEPPTAARSRAGFPPWRPRLSRDREDFVTPPRATRGMVHRQLQMPPPPGCLSGPALLTSPGMLRAQWSGKGRAAPLRRSGESGSQGFPGPDLGGCLSTKSPGEDSDHRPVLERDSPPAPQGRPEEPQGGAGLGGTALASARRSPQLPRSPTPHPSLLSASRRPPEAPPIPAYPASPSPVAVNDHAQIERNFRPLPLTDAPAAQWCAREGAAVGISALAQFPVPAPASPSRGPARSQRSAPGLIEFVTAELYLRGATRCPPLWWAESPPPPAREIHPTFA